MRGVRPWPLTIAALAVAVLAALPAFVSRSYFFHTLILANIYVVFAASWDLLCGYVGELNLGHALFFGMGAYTSAFLNTLWGVSPWLSLGAGTVVAVIFALLVGIPCLRLRGPYLAMVTIAFAMILYLLANSLSDITGGEEGIIRIRPLVVGTIPNYYLSLAFATVSVAILWFLARSDLGLTFRAIKENPDTAEACGVHLARYKLLAYVISAVFAGFIGSFYAHFLGIVTPDVLNAPQTFAAITMTIVGGLGTILGPALGAYVLTFVFDRLAELAAYRVLIYSTLLVVIILLMPGGLWGIVTSVAGRFSPGADRRPATAAAPERRKGEPVSAPGKGVEQ